MKTIIFLFGILVLCGCEENPSIKVSPENEIPFNNVIHFEYKNHQYIRFKTNEYDRSIGGVVHDPNCKYCNK